MCGLLALPLLLAAVLVASCGGSPQPAAGAAPVKLNIRYCSGGNEKLLMNLYFPFPPSARPAPVIVYLHPGGWELGDRTTGTDSVEFTELRRRGYAIASIDYRLAPKDQFPAQLEDAKCAVRFLRAKHEQYGLDAAHVGVYGASAGGHLAALLGLTPGMSEFEGGGGYANESSSVAAVVDVAGPADLTAPGLVSGNPGVSEAVFGVLPGPGNEVLQRASPVTYVTPQAPPFLIVHGDHDSVVPVTQSQALYLRLRAAGADAQFILVRNADHGLMPAGGAPTPTRDDVARMIADFFDRILRPGGPATPQATGAANPTAN